VIRILRACFLVLAATVAVMVGAPGARAAITYTEGITLTTAVTGFSTPGCMTFTPKGNCAFPDIRSVTIDWGDGTSSLGSYVLNTGCPPCQYTVTGTHTYAEAGSYTIGAMWHGTWGPKAASGSAGTNTVTVTNQSLTAQAAVSASASTGVMFSGRVATFSDGNSDGVAGDNTATITWGDGAASAGTVDAVSGENYEVTGSHLYAATGSRSVGVTVVNGGQTFTMNPGTMTVADPALAPTSVLLAASQGVEFSGTVARFTDPDTLATAGDFTASIAWGDGGTSAGTVSSASGGGFQITGAHTYTTAGAATVTVKVSFGSDSPATITSFAQITAAQTTTGTGTGTGTGSGTGTGTGAGTTTGTGAGSGTSTGTGSGAGSSAGPTAHTPPLNVGANMSIRHLKAGAETASMDIICAKHAVHACDGTLAATTRTFKHGHTKAAAKSGGAVVARTTFSVPAGKTARVELRLNRLGRVLVRARYQLAVTVALTGTSHARFGVTYGYVRVPTAITYDATYSKICCESDPVNDVVFTNVPRGARLAMVCRQGACAPHARTFRAHGQTLELGSHVVVTLPPHAIVDFEVTHPQDIGEVVEVTNRGVGPPPDRLLCLPPWLHHPVACPAD
jgi:hypothetical protein